MSDDSTDTSTIDEKKSDSSVNTYAANAFKFIITLTVLIIIIGFYFTTSGLLLYVCKLAQSNILPTELNCYPYTETKPDIQPVESNIFATTDDSGPVSMKIKFPYDEYNASNKVIDMFREYKNKPNSHFLANYLISITECIIGFNYSTINTILNMFNEMTELIPESVLVFVGPILIGFFSITLLIIDYIYIIYLWFAKMSWFFKQNTNDSSTGKPNWEDVTFMSPINYSLSILLVIVFVILLFIALPVLSIIPLFAISWCMFSCIFYRSMMNNKKTSVGAVIKDVFKYYKTQIMGLLSILTILLAFANLGPIQGLFASFVLFLINFGIIPVDIFKPIKIEDLSKLVSFKQAKKTCTSINENIKEKHGFLYNLIFGQKGGNITKELKKINKKLNNVK